MAIVLCRVDDRLLHGQVVLGWGQPLGIDQFILVDNQVSTSEWEQDLYRMSVTPNIEVRFVSVGEAKAHIAEWQGNGRRGLLLTGDVETIVALYAADPVTLHHINLGGIHHRAGRRERLPYLYLTDEELRSLEELEAKGADITAQDLPTTPPVSLRALT